MLAIPKVSSERWRYIPMVFVEPETIVNGSTLIIPNAMLYEFGVLMSNVHNAWMRIVAGRLETRYQYSNTVVYNNFPWCNPTVEQKAKIEQSAQSILDARKSFSIRRSPTCMTRASCPPTSVKPTEKMIQLSCRHTALISR